MYCIYLHFSHYNYPHDVSINLSGLVEVITNSMSLDALKKTSGRVQCWLCADDALFNKYGGYSIICPLISSSYIINHYHHHHIYVASLSIITLYRHHQIIIIIIIIRLHNASELLQQNIWYFSNKIRFVPLHLSYFSHVNHISATIR